VIRRTALTFALLLIPGAAMALSISPPPPGGGPPFATPPALEALPPQGGPPPGLAGLSLVPLNGFEGPPFGKALVAPPPRGRPDGVPPSPKVPAKGVFPLDRVPPPTFVRPVTPASVPEPGAALLLAASGAAGLAWWGRGRRLG
jgi:hypothetical protein